MKKEILILLTVVLLLFGVFGACSKKEDDAKKGQEPTQPELPTYEILAGPYILRPGSTSMTIRWELQSNVSPKMLYSSDTVTADTDTTTLTLRGNKSSAYLYEANLTGLKAGETYYYKLIAKESVWSEFKTYTENQENISFVAMGDSRSDPYVFSNIMERTNSKNPDFIVSMGDLVETGSEYSEWHEFFFSVAGKYLSSTPLMSTFGDHEVEGDDGELFRYFLMQDESFDKQWYSFDYGNAHIISLDYRFQYDDEDMIAWFKKDITDAGKKWNFVIMHKPVYNLGGYRKAWGRETWSKLFLDYEVDMVFAGHSHLYERFFPARPEADAGGHAVSYVTTGGAGAELYDNWNNKVILAATKSVNHFIDVKIESNTLSYKAITANGIVLDEFEMTKSSGAYDSDFEATIIKQEVLNTIAGFGSALSKDISKIPTSDEPAYYTVKLKSSVSQDIPYSIVLNGYADYYGVDEVKGILPAGSSKNAIVVVNKLKDFSVDEYGDFSPELRLKIVYEFNSKKDSITGRGITYWEE